MLAAMDWLVSEPNTTCFFHYSGHGGQVKDTDDSAYFAQNHSCNIHMRTCCTSAIQIVN